MNVEVYSSRTGQRIALFRADHIFMEGGKVRFYSGGRPLCHYHDTKKQCYHREVTYCGQDLHV